MSEEANHREAPGASSAPSIFPELLAAIPAAPVAGESIYLLPSDASEKPARRDLLSTVEEFPRPLQGFRRVSIQAIAVACGGGLIEELALFVNVVNYHHPEIPIFVLTDEAGAVSIDEETRSRIDHLEVLSDDEMKIVAETKATDHGSRWDRRWIGAKLEALHRALLHYGSRGVLLLDSDIILTRRLEQTRWDADLVLSTHRGPLTFSDVPEFHGRFNAGMILTHRLDIADRWIQLYREGAGTFFEQQCLERLSGEYVTDLFPAAWNWGGWRHFESLVSSGRRPAILHTHIVGKWGLGIPRRFEHIEIGKLAADAAANVRKGREIHPKWAFIHHSKAAGSSLGMALRNLVCPSLGFSMINSWGQDNSDLDRDWTDGELESFLLTEHLGNAGPRRIVHNHRQNWSDEVYAKYRAADYRFFALYRPIRERLVSFWFWNEQVRRRTGAGRIVEPGASAQSLDELLNAFLDNEVHRAEWTLPAWGRQIDYWYPATSDGIIALLEDLFETRSYEFRVNLSDNPGWDSAVQAGLISPETVARVESDPGVIAWDRFAEDFDLDSADS